MTYWWVRRAAHNQVAWVDVFDAVCGGDDVLVGEEGCAAFVPELSVLVLLERDLPRPLAVVGHSPSHDARAARAHEPAAAHVLVVRLGAQRVEKCPLTIVS